MNDLELRKQVTKLAAEIPELRKHLVPLLAKTAKKVQVKFKVQPKGSKVKYYQDLSKIPDDFTKEELKGADISVIIDAEVVGHLDSGKVFNQLY